jgi:hypothetical protein
MKYANRLNLSLLFVLIYLGQTSAQAYKTNSLGFECSAVEKVDWCRKCNGKGEYGQVSTRKIRCKKCNGASDEILLRFPCGDCSNTRLVYDPSYVPPKKCEPCSGGGRIFTLGHKFQVADGDYTEKLTINDAEYVFGTFGNGWRLPTINELTGMYHFLHKRGKGNFRAECYWSGRQDLFDASWYFNFGTRDADYSYEPTKYNTFGSTNANATTNVRAVRDLD